MAVIDYWIVGMDGPATTRSILSQDPECKVLLLSWFAQHLAVQGVPFDFDGG